MEDPPSTLASLARQDESLEAAILPILSTLPPLDPEPRTAPSMADAVAQVHARDDARKKVTSGPALSKAKRAARAAAFSAAEDRFPGAVRGGGDPAAFWLYVEDFFRDVAAPDLAALLPAACPDLDDDPLLHVPSLGPPPVRRGPAALHGLHPPPGPAAEHGTAASAPATPAAEPGSPDSVSMLERRSVRLVSRFQRGTTADEAPLSPGAPAGTPGDSGPAPLPASHLGRASGSVLQTLDAVTPAAAAAAPAAVTPSTGLSLHIPLGSSLPLGTGPEAPASLLETLSGTDLARLASGVMAFPTLPAAPAPEPGALAALAGSAEDAADSGSEKRGEARRALVDWLRERGAEAARATAALVPVPWPYGPPPVSAAGSEGPGPTVPPENLLLPSTLVRHPYTTLLLGVPAPPHVLASSHALSVPDPGVAGAPTAPRATGDEEVPSGASTPALRPQSPVPAPETGDAAPPRPRGAAAGKKQGARLAGGAVARDAASRPGSALGSAGGAAATQAPPPPPAAAVAACVAAARRAVPPWEQAAEAVELLAAAPQDELLAEILALQSELLVQRVANARRAAAALRGALGGLDGAAAARAARAKEEQVVTTALSHARDERRTASRQRRERAHREAMAQKSAVLLASPRPVLGRQRAGGGGGAGGAPSPEAAKPDGISDADGPLLGPNELYDVLAQRSGEEEAYCAVCSDGHSEAPNEIVFCERCDVAVHQRCYDIPELPAGEWLCHPCREYEAEVRAVGGEAAATLRPPRWAAEGDGHGGARHLPGGARDTPCALCPISCGAFRRAVPPDSRWVHCVCALWTPETFMLPGSEAGVVAGMESVRVDRTPCAICGLARGSVVTCGATGCTYAFHPLCARNLGLYLAARVDGLGRPQYRVYCAVHSGREQEKDQRAWAARAESAAASAAEAARREAALSALSGREEARRTLGLLRCNLEQARMLVDLTKKRERLKRQLITLYMAEHAGRQRDPSLALSRLQAQQSAAVQALLLGGMQAGGAGAAHQAGAAGAAASPPAGARGAPAPSLAPPGSAAQAALAQHPDAGAAWAALHAQQAQVLARLSAMNPGSLLRLGAMGPAGRGGGAAGGQALRPPFSLLPPGMLGLAGGVPAGFLGAGHVPASAPAPATTPEAPGAAGGKGGAARRGGGIVGASRRGRAPGRGGQRVVAGAPAPGPVALVGVPPTLASIATGGAGGAPGAGAAAALRIDRERVMTPREAAAANSRLPPKFKYVPLEELHAKEPMAKEEGKEDPGASASPTVPPETPPDTDPPPAQVVDAVPDDVAVPYNADAPAPEDRPSNPSQASPAAATLPPATTTTKAEEARTPAGPVRSSARASPKVPPTGAGTAARALGARLGGSVTPGASRATMRGVRGGGVVKPTPTPRRRR